MLLPFSISPSLSLLFIDEEHVCHTLQLLLRKQGKTFHPKNSLLFQQPGIRHEASKTKRSAGWPWNSSNFPCFMFSHAELRNVFDVSRLLMSVTGLLNLEEIKLSSGLFKMIIINSNEIILFLFLSSRSLKRSNFL